IPVAEEENWQLVSVLQPGCGLGVEGQTQECRKGNEAVLEYLDQLQPDAVLTTSTRAELMDGAAEHTVAGLEPIVRD
ncbi:acyltransferase, partial [Xanthomonas citri pv. citri]|nr:acyltransferase [Xanthomonas citri pv. citri]